MSSYLMILNATLEKVFDLEPGFKVFQEKALDEIKEAGLMIEKLTKKKGESAVFGG